VAKEAIGDTQRTSGNIGKFLVDWPYPFPPIEYPEDEAEFETETAKRTNETRTS
jgi:hypothetical protein